MIAPRAAVVRVAGALAACLAPAACVGPFEAGGACTASVEPAVIVEIRDAATRAPLAAGARGVVRSDAYVDSLRPHESSGPGPESLYSRSAAPERPGTYAVEVRHPGYRTWTLVPLRVPDGECHVRTQRVRAFLTREG